MPLHLNIKKKLSQRSDRVKAVDLHPTEPWALTALYNGHVNIWNYSTGELWKSFEIADLPIRAAKFIPRKQWFVIGSDDFEIRVFNYNTSEKVHSITNAHQDYIRYLEVHPSQPWLLSTSDDMTVKMWNWEKNWKLSNTFEGHAHYVMMARFNPKDSNTFASASLDRSIKVWGINSTTPNFSLEGHARGVNCIDYYHGGDKPYIISGADDFTLKIWDYQTKACVTTLEGHTQNVASVLFHPRLPVIISGSEDGTVRLWHSSTYRLENTLNYGLERCWMVGCSTGSNKVGLAFDDGTIVLKLGKETPVASLDRNGKFVVARNNVVSIAPVRGLEAPDGDKLPLALKEIGNVEIYAQEIKHNSNGRFLAVVGDNEYVIYTAQALRNKSFGSAFDFVWSATGSGDYAIRETLNGVKVFKNFKLENSFNPNTVIQGLFGGVLLAVRGADHIIFYDWDTLRVVRRIDVAPRAVYWSEAGDYVALACDDEYYVLHYDPAAFAASLMVSGPEAATIAEEGAESTFEVIANKSEKIRSATWVGDVLLYVNNAGRLNYFVGGEVITHAHPGKSLHLLGYLPKEQRVYMMDKSGAVVSYQLHSSILEYQTAVVRRNFEAANQILPTVPVDQRNNIARFLEGQGFKEEAFAVAQDPDLKFDLALQLNKLEAARDLMREQLAGDDSTDVQTKWKQLCDLALARSDLKLAEECALLGEDYGCLLLIYSSLGNACGLAELAQRSREHGRFNIAFSCMFLLRRPQDCVELLLAAGRTAEAAIFARSYLPSAVDDLVRRWIEEQKDENKQATTELAEPNSHRELFPMFDASLQAESILANAFGYNDAPIFSTSVDDSDAKKQSPLLHEGNKDLEAYALLDRAGREAEEQQQKEHTFSVNAARVGKVASNVSSFVYSSFSDLYNLDASEQVQDQGAESLKAAISQAIGSDVTINVSNDIQTPAESSVAPSPTSISDQSPSPTRSHSPSNSDARPPVPPPQDSSEVIESAHDTSVQVAQSDSLPSSPVKSPSGHASNAPSPPTAFSSAESVEKSAEISSGALTPNVSHAHQSSETPKDVNVAPEVTPIIPEPEVVKQDQHEQNVEDDADSWATPQNEEDDLAYSTAAVASSMNDSALASSGPGDSPSNKSPVREDHSMTPVEDEDFDIDAGLEMFSSSQTAEHQQSSAEAISNEHTTVGAESATFTDATGTMNTSENAPVATNTETSHNNELTDFGFDDKELEDAVRELDQFDIGDEEW